ncbi:MAG TPA: hypothetical protein VJ044_17785 [Candidatus Hodarchaeales archaeon]|nr:hypothetical protein [Candidatus Hodarchaeales archaeon]
MTREGRVANKLEEPILELRHYIFLSEITSIDSTWSAPVDEDEVIITTIKHVSYFGGFVKRKVIAPHIFHGWLA